MMKYLEEGELSEEEIKKGLRKGTIANTVVPMTCGSSYKNKGVQELLNAVVDYLPSPVDIPAIKGVDLDGNETDRKWIQWGGSFITAAFSIKLTNWGKNWGKNQSHPTGIL